MWIRSLPLAAAFAVLAVAQDERALKDRAQRYLIDLIKLDTTNPPGNETRAAQYLKRVADAEGIPAELLGDDPARLNFVARLKASQPSGLKPLLLMAHTDVVPADPSQWTVPAFSSERRAGYIYGRGAQDDKSLLAAELAVLVELKRNAVKLRRDIILVAEADEEAGSLGIQWLVKHAFSKIDAEFGINEGGFAEETASGRRLYQIQTTEKIPTRVILTARGKAGHGSLPRADNAVLHLARAITRITEADQPVALNTTTRRYLNEMAKLPDFAWLGPLARKLENGASPAVAREIRAREPEFDAILHSTVSPTMLTAGMKINVIPNSAEAHVDVRRLPTETREEVMARFRGQINDPAVEVSSAPGQDMPATEPSALTTGLYVAMERLLLASHPKATVIPYMSRGATDSSYLRQKGMALYGAPLFLRERGESRAHGNDERIAAASLDNGTSMLWKIVVEVAR